MARRVRVRGSRRQVWNGTRQKTMGGTTKSSFTKSKSGKIVSKKRQAFGRRQFKNIRGWINAVSKARKALGITGFCAVKKGTPLYIKAREFYCALVFSFLKTDSSIPWNSILDISCQMRQNNAKMI